MRIHQYHVINDTDDDCFGLTDDYEKALDIAREAARDRPNETILITRKGFAIRHLFLTPDGNVTEEEIN
jgi:hypothetical protein